MKSRPNAMPWSSNCAKHATRRSVSSGNTTPSSRRIDWWPRRSSDGGTRLWPECAHWRAELRISRLPSRLMWRPTERAFSSWRSNSLSFGMTPERRTKKRLVRLLIEEIVAKLPGEGAVELVIHWKGGKHTILHVTRNRTGRHRYCTSREVVDVVRDLARCAPDGQIARVLNRLGYQTGAGNGWTQGRVASLRSYHRIPTFDPEVDRAATLTIEMAAGELGVSTMTVRRMIVTGLL